MTKARGEIPGPSADVSGKCDAGFSWHVSIDHAAHMHVDLARHLLESTEGGGGEASARPLTDRLAPVENSGRRGPASTVLPEGEVGSKRSLVHATTGAQLSGARIANEEVA
jgi:hypothetical protein